MSDLQATSSRGQTAAPITAAAIEKLRVFGGNSSAFAQADGLVDAFAEVFARMAVAQPVREQPAAVNAENGPAVNSERPTETQQSDSSESAPSHTATGTDDDAQQSIVHVEPEAQEVDLRDDHEDVSQSIHLVGKDDADQIDVAALEVHQAEDETEETETPQVIAQEVIEYDDSGHRRRDRRDTAASEPIENTENGRWGGDRKSPDAERIQGSTDEVSADESLSFDSETHSDEAEAPRRVRRQNRGAAEKDPSSDSQAARSRPEQRPNPVTNTATSGGLTAIQSAANDAAPTKPAVRSADATVTNLQSVAQNAVRSNAASGTQAQTNSGTRGSTQAIESRTSLRDAARTGSESKPAKSNAAETLTRVKLIQRISKAFQHLGPDGGTVRLRLAPAEMGSVRVEMRINQRKVQARVVAESEAAGAALREHLPELRQRLESQGMEVERLEIESGDSESEFGSQAGRQGRGDSSHSDQPWSNGPKPSSDDAGRRSAVVSRSVSPLDHSHVTPEVSTSNAGVDVRF